MGGLGKGDRGDLSVWERIGLPPRLVALCALLWLTLAPLIALASGTANNPNNPNAATDEGPGPTGNEGWPFAVVNATGTTMDVNVAAFAVNPCVTQCTSPWVVSGTVTANQGTAGAAAWPVSAAQSGAWTVGVNNFPAVQAVSQSGTWTVQQGTPPWSVSQSGAPWTQRIQDGVGATLATVTAANAVKVDGSAVTQPVSGTVTANQGGAPWSVVGTLTNNNAAPGSNNVGVLPAVANAAAPTLTEGDIALLSEDLAGRLRVNDQHNNVVVSATFSRPANTTAYAANQTISDSTTTPTLLTFSGCARVNGGSGRIVSIEMIDEANQTTKLNPEAFVFNNTVAAAKDGVAIATTNADAEKIVGSFNSYNFNVMNTGAGAAGNVQIYLYPTPNGGSGGFTDPVVHSGVPFVCQAGSTNLYMILLSQAAYTPISAEHFKLIMGIIQD